MATVCAAGCTNEVHAAEQETGKFPVTTPLRTDTSLTKEYVAQIRAIQHIELRALEKGYVQGIFVDEGQHVKHGEKMFQIMPLIYQAEVEKAAAEAEQTEIEYNNTKALADKDVVSQNELALAKANFARAKASLSLAGAHKSLTEIRAPFDGIMGRFEVRLGSLVDEGDLLTTLSDNHNVWVYFNVSEAEYLKYDKPPSAENPLPVELEMANGQIFDQPGSVQTIEADFNNQTGNLAFRATFPNPDGKLRHGQTGKILVTVPLKNALLIPQKATFDVLDRKFVYVVDAKGVVHSKPITVAEELPRIYAVASGLDEKDRVLLDGQRKVRDGSVIEVEYEEPKELLKHLEVPAE
ncbi:MAG: efflux RND transporter periplasmic adaptor subunit [Polyangiales bacterium]